MKNAGFMFGVAVIAMVALLGLASAETINWTNPTTYTDNTAITATDKANIKNYLRYRVPPATGTWAYFAETAGGKSSWTGTFPAAAGVPAEYTVSAAITGPDGVENDSLPSPAYAYTVPFPPGRTLGRPSGITISR